MKYIAKLDYINISIRYNIVILQELRQWVFENKSLRYVNNINTGYNILLLKVIFISVLFRQNYIFGPLNCFKF